MKRIFPIAIGLALLTGCAAYNGLIGHPLHVLIQEHQDNERQKEATALGEAMYRDTHPGERPAQDWQKALGEAVKQ